MLRRTAYILIEILLGLVLVVAGVLFWASYHIDTPEFRQQFDRALTQLLGQPVSIGELNIAIYPSLSLEVQNLIVHEGADEEEALVQFDVLLVSARILPLLSDSLQIRSILVEAMQVNVVIDQNGKSNWHALLEQRKVVSDVQESGGLPFKEVSLNGLEVINASIYFSDEQTGHTYRLTGINLRTGSIRPGHSVPFTASSRFAWRNGGVASDLKLTGALKADLDGKNLTLDEASAYATLGGPFLPEGVSPGELTARVLVDFQSSSISLNNINARFMGIRVDGDMSSGDLSESISAEGRFKVRRFKPSTMLKRLFPELPVSSVQGLDTCSMESEFVLTDSELTLRNLRVALDEMTLDGAASIQKQGAPLVRFDLQGGTLDLDRYLPLFQTGTPYIWDDFNLPFFAGFRGKGSVVLDQFKVLDQLFIGVSAQASGTDSGVKLNGAGAWKGYGPVTVESDLAIERGDNGTSTLGGNLSLTLDARHGGLGELILDDFSLSGIASIKARLNVPTMQCDPQARSINLLRHMSGSVGVALGPGMAHAAGDEPYQIAKYDRGKIYFAFSPLPREYGWTIDTTADGQGGTYESFAVAAKGPVAWDLEDDSLSSSGLKIKVDVTGPMFGERSNRLAAEGDVVFSTQSRDVAIDRIVARALGTQVEGDCRIVAAKKGTRVEGRFNAAKAVPRRIIHMLTGESIKTRDPQALMSARATAVFAIDGKGFTLKEIDAELDGMSLAGQVQAKGLEHPMISFSLNAGSLDVDRYRPPSEDVKTARAGGNRSPEEDPVSMPLEFLQSLRLDGKIVFDEFKLASIRARPLSAKVKADRGVLRIANLKGKVHEGILAGDCRGTVREGQLNAKLELHVEDMQAGPLMTEMFERAYVKGETDLDANLSSRGVTDDDLLRNLEGKTWVRIRNGSYKFTGYGRKQPAKKGNLYGQSREVVSTKQQRTVFRKAMAYFTVEKGTFKADRFRIEAPPVLQSYGSGSFNLPDDSIDLTIRNDFVAVPSVTIRLTGKLSNPEVSVPKERILNDTVRNILSLPEKSFNFLRDLFN